LGLAVFEHLNFESEFQIPSIVLQNFLQAVEAGYKVLKIFESLIELFCRRSVSHNPCA